MHRFRLSVSASISLVLFLTGIGLAGCGLKEQVRDEASVDLGTEIEVAPDLDWNETISETVLEWIRIYDYKRDGFSLIGKALPEIMREEIIYNYEWISEDEAYFSGSDSYQSFLFDKPLQDEMAVCVGFLYHYSPVFPKLSSGLLDQSQIMEEGFNWREAPEEHYLYETEELQIKIRTNADGNELIDEEILILKRGIDTFYGEPQGKNHERTLVDKSRRNTETWSDIDGLADFIGKREEEILKILEEENREYIVDEQNGPYYYRHITETYTGIIYDISTIDYICEQIFVSPDLLFHDWQKPVTSDSLREKLEIPFSKSSMEYDIHCYSFDDVLIYILLDENDEVITDIPIEIERNYWYEKSDL